MSRDHPPERILAPEAEVDPVGCARETANVVLGNVSGIPCIAIDTRELPPLAEDRPEAP